MKNISDVEIDKKQKYYRIFEMLPGFLTWGTFLLPLIISIKWPYIVADVVIVYATYWLVRAIVMSTRLVFSYFNYRKSVAMDWLQMTNNKFSKDKVSEVYHMIVLATYKEELDTLKYSLKALVESNYDLKKVIFVLATEERDKIHARECTKELRKEFEDKFYYFIVTEHPMGIIGEVKGKGSNITHAAKEAMKFIEAKKIDPKKIILTTLDADNRVHREYLACLTYKYLDSDDPTHKSFQPLTMYFNNIWRVPIFMRSISVGGSFWQMIESTRPYRMRNFSAHAQTFDALIETNFWSTKTIVEDGHQYWRTYFTFNGNHQIVPLPIPVYQDAVLSPKGYIATIKEQYIQKRRWAWGCSDIPYVFTYILKHKELPFFDKWTQLFRLIENHYFWASTSIVLAISGWIPMIINEEFRSTVLAYTFPTIYSSILRFSMFGLVITLILSSIMLPPRPKGTSIWNMVIEWMIYPIILPVSNIIFGSFAAIDAQTRLLRGKYLEFKVTEKAPYYNYDYDKKNIRL